MDTDEKSILLLACPESSRPKLEGRVWSDLRERRGVSSGPGRGRRSLHSASLPDTLTHTGPDPWGPKPTCYPTLLPWGEKEQRVTLDERMFVHKDQK